MKVIFLDIDGVLNSNDWYVKTRGIGGYNGGDVDPKCIELINDLIDATGAKIIMSSSWRSDYENSCEYLYDNGLYCDAIIGKTLTSVILARMMTSEVHFVEGTKYNTYQSQKI